MARWSLFAAFALTAAMALVIGLNLSDRARSPGAREPVRAAPPKGNVPLEPRPLRQQNQPRGEAEPEAAQHLEPAAPEEHDERASAEAARNAELSREVVRLKRREAETRAQLEASNRQLEAYDAQQRSFAPREFDLGPEDWRRLGRQGTLKLRIPCPVSPGDDLTRAQLDSLGLAPEDGALVAAAFQHSAERVWAAIGPLCAQVLRSTPERAAARGPNLCRRLILSDAARKGTALPAFRHAAAYLAGDAPEPSKPSPVEALVLELAQEQDRLKAELAESFGPEEADRLVFSEGLCFTEATHQLDQRQTATHPAATATSQ